MLALWLVLGLGYSAAQTPFGRLLRRSAHAEERPAVFAAQFALSHTCWLICYPLAGQMGATPGSSLPDWDRWISRLGELGPRPGPPEASERRFGLVLRDLHLPEQAVSD